MAKHQSHDIPREHLGELIESWLIHARDMKEDYLEDAQIALESNGVVSVKLLRSEGEPIYTIRVTRRDKR